MALAARSIESTKFSASDAILVTLTMTQWQITATDKEAGEAVAVQYGASAGAKVGKYRKNLINPKAPEIKALNSAFNKVREFHNQNTLPWNEKARLLPPSNYKPYMEGIEELKTNVYAAVDAFCDKYEELITEAEAIMGRLFRYDEYPDRSKVREQYTINVIPDPVPDVSHYRLTWLSETERKKIEKETIERRLETEKVAMSDLWTRLYEVVNKMAEKLADPDTIFRGTLIGNIEKLVELLPRMNIGDDPGLARMTETVKEQLLKYDPETLRADKGARKTAASAAGEIAGKIRRIAKVII